MRARFPFWTAVLALAGALGMLGGCKEGPVGSRTEASEDERRAARERMVAKQLAARGIRDARVLAAMRKVPRHRFVPAGQEGRAYEDRPLAIGNGQTISQPFVVAFMSQALELKGDERVLDVGTGSGYQAAILGELAREVWSLEIVAPLAESAGERLRALGHANVHVRCGDGYQGWSEHAPFDAILVAAAPDHVPQPLVDQLALGGRMILPVGKGEQDLVLLRKTPAGLVREEVLPVRFVPMTGMAEEQGK
jgi:protein-L-isoaspartate(D-aspartate) O-methyltransferase